MSDSVEICNVCSHGVNIAIYKGSGLCSDLCRKVHAGEISYDDMVRAVQAQRSHFRGLKSMNTGRKGS